MSSVQLAYLEGVTRHYKGNGRKLGYPTANIATKTDLADGVYFGYADLSDYIRRPAIIFIGTPTTVGDTEHRIEAHLLDITDKDYYDLPIALSVENFHRSNQHFPSSEALQEVMKRDELTARDWFANQQLASKLDLADS